MFIFTDKDACVRYKATIIYVCFTCTVFMPGKLRGFLKNEFALIIIILVYTCLDSSSVQSKFVRKNQVQLLQ